MSETGVYVFVDRAESPQRESIEICIVGPINSQGGVSRSVMYISLVYRMLGFKVRVVPFPKRMSVRNCRVVHTHGSLFLDFIKMIFENPKAIRIITFHGWVLDEAIAFLRYHKDKNVLRRIGGFFLTIIIWLLNKYLFLRLYHCVRAVSRITARPELGHAVIEAISLGIPIVKCMEYASEEEIRDGVNRILAYNDTEMLLKLYNYVINIDIYKAELSRSAQESILLSRSLKKDCIDMEYCY